MKKNTLFRKSLVCVILVLFVSTSVIPCISGNSNQSKNVAIVKDTELSPLSVTVTFTHPGNGIYYFDKKILPFSVPLILRGKITVKAEIESGSEVIDRIEFYINDVLYNTITGIGPHYDFTWAWEGSIFSKVNFKIIACATDNTQASDEITIYRILL
jgi:hypothetical protein